MTTKPLIRIVDDDEALKASFVLLLQTMGWDVASYGDGPSFLAQDSLEGPGCVVLDVRMPGMTGLEVQQAMAERGSLLPIVFLSAHGTISMAVHTLQQGAVDFLEKPVQPMELVQKIAQAVTQSLEICAQASQQQALRRRFESLTPREAAIVSEVLRGNDANKMIAKTLGIEVSTVKMHRANAFIKLDVHSPAELTRLAFEAHWHA
ncbi:MAG: response regulator transcription factor [Duodenibacillus sp.]